MEKERLPGILTYPADIYRCFVFDDDSKVAKFRSVKDKAFSKRLSLYNTSPTPPWPHELRYRREKHCKTMKIKLNILLYINIFTQRLYIQTLSFAIISISFVHSYIPTYRQPHKKQYFTSSLLTNNFHFINYKLPFIK